MKFFSIDVETTGLNIKKCQLLEVGICYCNTDADFYHGSTYRSWVVHHHWIEGEPFALDMNKRIIEQIKNGEGLLPKLVFKEVADFIKEHLGLNDANKPFSFTAAGKNFQFDNEFLIWDNGVKPRHRVLDPGSMYARSTDEKPPDLKTCCERAGVPVDDKQTHRAAYDAMITAHCVYNHLRKGQPPLC